MVNLEYSENYFYLKYVFLFFFTLIFLILIIFLIKRLNQIRSLPITNTFDIKDNQDEVLNDRSKINTNKIKNHSKLKITETNKKDAKMLYYLLLYTYKIDLKEIIDKKSKNYYKSYIDKRLISMKAVLNKQYNISNKYKFKENNHDMIPGSALQIKIGQKPSLNMGMLTYNKIILSPDIQMEKYRSGKKNLLSEKFPNNNKEMSKIEESNSFDFSPKNNKNGKIIETPKFVLEASEESSPLQNNFRQMLEQMKNKKNTKEAKNSALNTPKFSLNNKNNEEKNTDFEIQKNNFVINNPNVSKFSPNINLFKNKQLESENDKLSSKLIPSIFGSNVLEKNMPNIFGNTIQSSFPLKTEELNNNQQLVNVNLNFNVNLNATFINPNGNITINGDNFFKDNVQIENFKNDFSSINLKLQNDNSLSNILSDFVNNKNINN